MSIIIFLLGVLLGSFLGFLISVLLVAADDDLPDEDELQAEALKGFREKREKREKRDKREKRERQNKQEKQDL